MITSITILAILVGVLVVAVLRLGSTNYKLIEQIEKLKKDHEILEAIVDSRYDAYLESVIEMSQDIENLMEDVSNLGIK